MATRLAHSVVAAGDVIEIEMELVHRSSSGQKLNLQARLTLWYMWLNSSQWFGVGKIETVQLETVCVETQIDIVWAGLGQRGGELGVAVGNRDAEGVTEGSVEWE